MKNRIYSSLSEMKNLRIMTQCALLMALYLVLGNFSFYITPTMKFTVTYIAIASISMIAGPVAGFFCGGMVEVFGYLLHSQMGAFHPGITFTSMLNGFIMGLFFYQRDVKLWRVISARAIVSFILNLGLNTYWLSTLMGKAFVVLLPSRLLKTVVLFPIEVLLIFLTLKTVTVIQRHLGKVHRQS